jgi:hypothetical protein
VIGDSKAARVSLGRGGGTGKGRAKGTPNKDRQSLVEAIQRAVAQAGGTRDFDAVYELAKLAVTTSDEKIKMMCLSDVAQYTPPKRKAIEVSGDINHEDGSKRFPTIRRTCS